MNLDVSSLVPLGQKNSRWGKIVDKHEIHKVILIKN